MFPSAIISLFIGIFAQADLQKMFETEKSFLVLQKKELAQQKTDQFNLNRKAKSQLDAEVKKLTAELAKVQVENEKMQNQLTDLQRQAKEVLGSEKGVEAIFKKIVKKNSELEQARWLRPATRDESPLVRVSKPELSDVINELEVTVSHWSSLQKDEKITGSVKSETGDWVQGDSLRIGSIGALFKGAGGENRILAPIGDGILGMLPKNDSSTPGSESSALYVFSDYFHKSEVRKAPGAIEAMANILPGVVLGLIFMLVSGLFIIFVRE